VSEGLARLQALSCDQDIFDLDDEDERNQMALAAGRPRTSDSDGAAAKRTVAVVKRFSTPQTVHEEEVRIAVIRSHSRLYSKTSALY
jgi:hypothetical protein